MLDASGEKTGEVVRRSEAHRLGLWHRCFHCWIVAPGTPTGDGPYLFVQRRAAGKETWPGKLDVTVGGHLGTGEGPVEGGLREIEEELGLRAAPEELVPLGLRRSERTIPDGLDREFQDVFLLVRPLAPDDLRLREDEVAAVLRLRLGDAEALRDELPAEEWSPGGNVRPVRARLSDFIPDEQDYLRRVARAARAYFRNGEVPAPIF